MGRRSPTSSGSFQPTMSFAALATRSWSAADTPIMSERVSTGSRSETRSTRSHSPSGASSETMLRAWTRIRSSIRATCRVVNAEATSRRSLTWRGASRIRNDDADSAISSGMSSNITPRPEQKVCGFLLTATTSSWRTTAQ